MKNDKPIYCIPTLEVVRFPEEDVLAASGISLHGNNPGDVSSDPGEGSNIDVGDLFPETPQ